VAQSSNILLTYSPPKMGKTVDTLFSFPTALFIGSTGLGGFKPALNVCGYEPTMLAKDTLGQVNEYLARVNPTPGIVVVDDLSLLSDNSWKVLSNTSDKFKMWNEIVAEVNALIYIARAKGFHLILNCHEVGPGMKENAKERTFMPGGPKMPSVSAGQTLAKSVDSIFRAVVADTNTGEAGMAVLDKRWPVVYRAKREDAEYTTGDRILGATGFLPINSGELLRCGGANIPRIYEWQETAVEQISNLFKENAIQDWESGKAQACFKEAIKYLEGKAENVLQVRWTLRDAQSRYFFRNMKQNVLGSYGA
jgi:hypothetical protein